MDALTYEDLVSACHAGGASVLTSVTELAPAAGPHAGIAPARYTRGRNGTYAYETRFIDGRPRNTVVVDGKASQLNRVEDAIALAIQEGDPALIRMPRMRVDYGEFSAYDYELPHRFVDGHFRFGTVDGKPTTDNPVYRAARNSTPADSRALLELSPVSLVLGSWDSSRKSHQARYRSCAVGEIIGVLADQSENGREPPPRGAARKDDIAPSVRLSGPDMLALLETQKNEMSAKTVTKIEQAAKNAKSGTTSASVLGLGAIPPSLDALGLVACSRIIRSHVLSFAALRQLRFGANNDADVACRALLAALALHGIALADEELCLRANCDLVEKNAPQVQLDGRRGSRRELSSLTREITGPLLSRSISEAVAAAGLTWEGQVFEVVGNEKILAGVESNAEDED